MLTTEQIADWFTRFHFMPGWSFEVYDGPREGQHLNIQALLPDAYTPGGHIPLDVHTFIPPCADEAQLQAFVNWRLRRMWMHEVDEFFVIDETRPYDPHGPLADQDR
jgi:hypothetical protein